ncbi:type I glutamate--ammonia ligase [bacterium]|nr:type I glutamate--ammonia ligase [bacterium]MBU1880861.1 type I glutamate--ammonia ligase [bacterium]
MKDLNDIERFLKEREIVMVDLKYTDLFGGWHHVTLPASHATPEVLEKGIGFDSSSIPGFKSIEAGDMCLFPDPKTAFIDPFWDESTLSFICTINEADTKKPFYRDPRSIAEKAEAYLQTTGVADRSQWGPEFEYFVFSSVNFEDETHWQSYRLDAPEAHWNSHDIEIHGSGLTMPPKGGYHAIPPVDQYYNLRSQTVKYLQEAGVEVHYHHHEVGCPSQQEIEVVLGPLARMADVAMMVKYFVKMTAQENGFSATFMPKPMYREAGSGMHFHQHLFKGDQPVFFDEKGSYANLSKVALSYIAGILQHAPALLALTNPSTNSYKRLVPGYEAPVNMFFSLANRTAAVRVPKYANAPLDKRIEFRSPDATCNPYIAMAAILMAGIDGIKKNLDPTELGFGPYDQNLFAPEHEDLRRQIKGLPVSLNRAFKALEDDHDFLTAGDVFPKDIVRTWIDYKLKKEFLEVRNRPHPYEVALYYNC